MSRTLLTVETFTVFFSLLRPCRASLCFSLCGCWETVFLSLSLCGCCSESSSVWVSGCSESSSVFFLSVCTDWELLISLQLLQETFPFTCSVTLSQAAIWRLSYANCIFQENVHVMCRRNIWRQTVMNVCFHAELTTAACRGITASGSSALVRLTNRQLSLLLLLLFNSVSLSLLLCQLDTTNQLNHHFQAFMSLTTCPEYS